MLDEDVVAFLQYALKDVGSAEPRALTDGAQSAGHPEWTADGKSIAFVSARPLPKDGSMARPQVYLLPLNGGEARALTNLKGGVTEFRFSPDGSRLVCLSPSGPAGDAGGANAPDKSDTRHYKHAAIKVD